MQYVIIRDSDGWYVADVSRNPTGGSYTNRLQYAKRFPSRTAAQLETCGNERVVPL